jgi:hypothetical protein
VDDLSKLKLELKENDMPYFTDEELQYYLDKNDGNLNNTIYECLLVKSESTSLNMSGLSTVDTSSYFKRLASKYKPSNAGTLGE